MGHRASVGPLMGGAESWDGWLQDCGSWSTSVGLLVCRAQAQGVLGPVSAHW